MMQLGKLGALLVGIALLTTTYAHADTQAADSAKIEHLEKTATAVRSIAVTPAHEITNAQYRRLSTETPSAGATFAAIFKLLSLCKDETTWNTSKTCYLYFDSGGLHSLGEPLLKSGAALHGANESATPAPIQSLAPDPNDTSNQTDYQAQINSAQQLLQSLQATSASPSPCATGFPDGFCDALASPRPLTLNLALSKTVPITIPFAQVTGQLGFQGSITPPGLAFPDLQMPATSLASADANLTFTPPGDITKLLPTILTPSNDGADAAPAPAPSAISLADASVTVVRPTAGPSPAPSPTPYVEAKATFYGNHTVFDRMTGFNDALPPSVQAQSTSTNVCPGERGEPLLVAFSLGVPGVNLILSATCPMIASYQIDDTWLPNEVSVVAAPKFALGIIGDAEVTGVVGSLLSGGGEAELNVANGEMRAYALSYAINDTYKAAPHTLVVGSVLFGHYEVGGGDVFAMVTFGGHTVFLRLIHVAPAAVKNFGQSAFAAYNVDTPASPAP